MRLIAQGARYAFGRRVLLDDLDLDVGSDESVAIVGPSGSGKTTLLSLLGGLLRPKSGRVSVISDHNVESHPLGQVSWVLQTVNVLSDRTVIDNVALGGYSERHSRASAIERARVCLEVVGLAEFADRPVRALSGGEIQRVVIARALASERPFILADEPTGQLDRVTTETVMNALSAASSQRGLVVVTHDATVAARCGRVLELRDGKLVPV